MILSEVKGKQLRQWREERGWQRSWLADRIGASHSALWKWEQEDALVPVMVLEACAAVEAKLIPILKKLSTKGA